MRLDDLLAELQSRLEAVLATRDRVHSLLEAVVSVGSELDLETVLHRIVESATALVNASYGALGVIGEESTLVQFVPVGLSEEEIARIEHWPHGLGLLGLLIKEPQSLRLRDIADHPDSYGFPAGHPPMRSFLGVPIRVRDEIFGNLYLTEKRNGEFDEEDEAIVTALATAAGVAIENARLYEETRRREAWLEVSSEVTTSLLSGADPHDVLVSLARRTREMTDADVVTISFGASPETLRVEIAEGLGAEELLGIELSAGETVAGRVLRTAEPQIADIRACPDTPSGLPKSGPSLSVPLGKGRLVRGVLGLGKRTGRLPFSSADLRMVQALAGQAAVALELAEARKDAERLGLLEDRDRIAKDLHDVVIQRLFAAAMTLMSVVKLVEKPEVTGRVQHVVDELDATIRQIRSTIFALHTPREEKATTVRGQLMDLVESARGHLGFMPGVRLEGALDTLVTPKLADQLLAVLREALSNVVRHAHATEVSVTVDARDAVLLLEVADNGVGVPEEGRRSGLRNLAERAELLGGTFEVLPHEPRGTCLSWRVPLA
ncbi:GAF domain-containing sensor histidine kinase [Microtetraspora niveoalba]|uniref:GAF domain-containing sensor histidine kinase n=1 Tax=Microtetraspora niveoalba TaxID=46175 RepID=UPI0024812757|nr:GAF domain-containing protein [Microtetraspora niveoalba]